jgi:glutamyl/glutaminyl-tRNA synthetase
VNYLSLLGWSAGDDREVLSKEELIDAMDLTRIGATDTAFDPEKLLWMSAQHIARMELSELAAAVSPYIDRSRYPEAETALSPAIEAIRSRLRTYGEVNEHLALLFPSEEALQSARREVASDQQGIAILRRVGDVFSALDVWNAEGAAGGVRLVGKEFGVTGPALFHPVRLALFGARNGPDLGKLLAALGRERTLELLRAAVPDPN